ncbi:hypothetical protein NA56DRAFT_691078 [Hyaloscypha hepaticicola]|uniref:F-box domain-containing protein n=1 Tax=Hyaloscypha hepaticicola TaxID=2082293 RepID=A0A2J6PX83_9HELO|nr:hypothetical protein NA56DRAFT_691078 [Hyaloscypha hepaticicola]
MIWKITCATSESSLLKLLSRLGRSMALSATTAISGQRPPKRLQKSWFNAYVAPLPSTKNSKSNPKKVESMNIEELRAALVEVQRERDEAIQAKQAIQSKQSSSPTSSQPECFFLGKIPREVRDHIYKLLFVNKVLATNRSIDRSNSRPIAINYIPEKKFDLAPQLLRTCSQIYAEASKILYESNTFILDCVENQTISSPILRHGMPDGSVSDSVSSSQFDDHLAIKKVKHWKLVTGAFKLRSGLYWNGLNLQAPLDSVTRFCQAISQHPPKSLSICIDAGEIQPHHISPDLVKELTLLTQDSTPVKHLFLMNKRLISYTQTFERNYLFKSMMSSSQGKALCRLRSVRDAPSNHDAYFANLYHPVENALDHASAAVEIDALSYFLEARQTVLEYLEPKYRRITESALQMVEYVKDHKTAGGLQQFGQRSEAWAGSAEYRRSIEGIPSRLFSTGVLLVEEYAKSFVRDAPWTTQVNIRRIQHEYDLSYSTLPRELLLHQLGRAFESKGCWKSLDRFLELFKLVVDDMDKQLLEIRKARRSFSTWTSKISDMISI